MAVTLETLLLAVEVNHQELTAGLSKANKQVDTFAKKTQNNFKLLKATALGIFGSQFLRSVVNAAGAMQQLEARLKTSTGSALAAGEAMLFLTTMAKRQSVDVLALADGYTRLLPSVKSGAITMEEMRNILGLVNDNMRAFGASSEDAKFIFFGLSQLLGSGIVTMENLKQVTERLPGSLEALAKATKMPLGELIDWVSTGKVTAQMLKGPLLEAFAINKGAAEALANTYDATVTRMINSFRNLSSELGKSGALDALTFMLDTITKLSDAIARNADKFKILVSLFVQVADPLGIVRKELKLINDALTEQAEKADKATKALERRRKLIDEFGTAEPKGLFFGTGEEKEGFVGPLSPRFAIPGTEEDERKIPTPTEKPEEIIGKGFEREMELREEHFMHLQELEQREKDSFRKKLEEERAMFEEHMGILFTQQMKFAKRFKNFDELSTRNKVATVVGGLQQLTEAGAKHNKKLFEINKAAGIANTVVSTASAMMKAFEHLGPIAGAVAATGIAALGAAQIATIASQQFQGGGGGRGGGGAAIASSPATQGVDGGGGGGDRGLSIAIQGVDRSSSFTGEQVRELLSAINDEIEDGAIIKGVNVV